MTNSEKKRLLQLLTEINDFDLLAAYKQQWPDGIPDNELVGAYDTESFAFYLNKMVIQMRHRLEKDWVFLSNLVYDPELENTTLAQLLEDLFNALENSHWPNSSEYLSAIIRVLINWNAWDVFPDSKANHSLVHDKLLKKSAELEINLENARSLHDSLRSRLRELTSLVEDKTHEAEEIESLRDAARNDRSQIETILQEGQVKQETLANIIQKQEEHRNSIDKILKRFQENDEKITARLQEIEEQQKSSKSTQEEIEGKRDEIIRLTGMAADGSLGHTFKERFKALEKAVRFWQVGILVAFIIGVMWYAVSSLLIPVPESAGAWGFFLSNSLKLSPSFILIIWALRQYGRERGLLEEYAFKAAVAQTVHAYADELANDQYGLSRSDFADDDEHLKYLRERDVLRKDLIKETVNRLYRDPKASDNMAGLMLLRPRAGKELLVELKEIVKELHSAFSKPYR